MNDKEFGFFSGILNGLAIIFVVAIMVLITAVLSMSYEVFDELRANTHTAPTSVLK